MDEHKLPQCSLFGRTGRGCAALYLLKDVRNPDLLPEAFPERIAFYKRIMGELQERFRVESIPLVQHYFPEITTGLPVDPIHDAARVIRLPGSINTKAAPKDQQVSYLIQSDDSGYSFRYTLNDLARILDIKPMNLNIPDTIHDVALGDTSRIKLPLKTRSRQAVNPGTAPKRARGRTSLGAQRAQDIMTLSAYFGGFDRGNRWRVLTLYAIFLKVAGIKRVESMAAVRRLADDCNPPYPSDPEDIPIPEIVDIAATKQRMMGNRLLCKVLRITPQVAREANLLTILPEEVTQERKNTPSKRRSDETTRCTFLKTWLKDNGNKLPQGGFRTLAEIVTAETGIKVSYTRVRRDLETMGINKHFRRGRKAKTTISLPF